MTDIIIVGGGASGLIAAIEAARTGASVVILEHMDIAGKKLLATGNGKCNFTNKKQGIEFYRGMYPAFVLGSFKQFWVTETLRFFEEIGVPAKERNGYYYPYNEEASAIREALLLECKGLGVQIYYKIGIRSIQYQRNHFVFEAKNETYQSRCCIMATGGKAAKKTGSDGSGFLYLDNFRQPCLDMVPSLVQLKGKQAFFREIAGIRAISGLKLYVDNRYILGEEGELQITDYGISGIPVFQLSRFASYGLKEGKAVHVLIDFLPEYSLVQSEKLLRELCQLKARTPEEALLGVLHKKMIPLVLRLAGLSEKKSLSKLTASELSCLRSVIKEFRVDIAGTNTFEQAQVTAGGIDTAYVSCDTLESALQKNLFFCGEILDIDGMCGGYNLQWAWSSGHVAGVHAAQNAKEL